MDLEGNAPTTMVEYDSDFDVEQAVPQGFSAPPMLGGDTPSTLGLRQPFKISKIEMHGSESDEWPRESQSIQNPSLPVMPGSDRHRLQFEFSLASERSFPARERYLQRTYSNNIRFNSMNFDQQEDQITGVKIAPVDQRLLLPEQDSLDIKIQQALRHPAIRDTRIYLICHDQTQDRRNALDLVIHQSPFTVQGHPFHRNGDRFNLGWRREGNNFLHASADEILTLIRRLKIVFSRFPNITFLDFKTRRRFIRSIINHLIRHSYQSFQAKAEIHILPTFNVERNDIACNLYVYGFDFTPPDAGNASHTVGCYSFRVSLRVRSIRSEPVVIPYEEKYLWTPSVWGEETRSDKLTRRLEETHNSNYREQCLQAYRLAQQIQVTFDGYVGPMCYAQWLISQLRDKNNNTRRRRGIYNGDSSMWTIEVSTYSSYICPSRGLRLHVKNFPNIHIQSPLSLRWLSTLHVLLDEYLEHGDVRRSWRAAAFTADDENVRIRNGLMPSRDFCECVEKVRPNWFHLCCRCHLIMRCTALRKPPGHVTALRFCEDCLGEADRMLNQQRAAAYERPTSLGFFKRLRSAVMNDYKMIYGRYRPQSICDQAEDQLNTLIAELRPFSLERDGTIYAWRDAFVPGICGDDVYAIPGEAEEVWFGRIYSPFLASPDGIFQVARDPRGRLGYHVPGNVAITSIAFNHFCGRFPKILLPLVNISHYAASVKTLEYVAKAMRNIVNTTHEIPILKQDRVDLDLPIHRVREIREALRTAQPLPGPKDNRHLWRLKGSNYNWRPESVHPKRSDRLHYRYEQLNAIAALPRYRHIPRSLWLRNEVFFPFSQRTPIQDWTDEDVDRFFGSHLRTLRGWCDRVAAHRGLFNKETLIQVSLRNFLDQAQQLSDGTWVSRDEIGFEGWPYTNTPLTISIGHKKHGRPLTTRYPEGVSYPKDQKNHDETKNNFTWETWCWNCEKSSFNSRQTIDQLIARHRNLRAAEEVQQYYQIVPEDELNEDTNDVELITSARQKNFPRRKKVPTRALITSRSKPNVKGPVNTTLLGDMNPHARPLDPQNLDLKIEDDGTESENHGMEIDNDGIESENYSTEFEFEDALSQQSDIETDEDSEIKLAEDDHKMDLDEKTEECQQSNVEESVQDAGPEDFMDLDLGEQLTTSNYDNSAFSISDIGHDVYRYLDQFTVGSFGSKSRVSRVGRISQPNKSFGSKSRVSGNGRRPNEQISKRHRTRSRLPDCPKRKGVRKSPLRNTSKLKAHTGWSDQLIELLGRRWYN